MYGIGQGFSLPTSDSSVQAEQRLGAKADSVGLYIKQIGNKILNQIVPYKRAQYVIPGPSDYGVTSSPDLCGKTTQGFKPLPTASIRAITTTSAICPKTQEHRSEKAQSIFAH